MEVQHSDVCLQGWPAALVLFPPGPTRPIAAIPRDPNDHPLYGRHCTSTVCPYQRIAFSISNWNNRNGAQSVLLYASIQREATSEEL
jgi:hypothetical protein